MTDARIDTTADAVMTDTGIGVVTAMVIEACSDFGVGIEGND